MDRQDPKQNSSSLQSLPSELLSNVFGYAPQGALYQLTLVNKRIGQLAVPALYESFSRYGGDSTQVRQYFRTAQRVPELAKHLRDITIQGSLKITHKQVRKCLRKISKESWVQNLYLYDPQLAYKYFSYGPDLAVLLLLSLDPKVRSIRALHPPNPIKHGYGLLLPVYLEPIRAMLAAGDALPPWTNTLSTLEISLRLLSWRCIAPLFRLPVLKTLILNDGCELAVGAEGRMNHKASTEVAILARSSSIEELDFGRCIVSSTTVANAVSACKTLRILRHMDCIDDKGSENLRLFKRLHEHANTLHTLKTCCWESAESQLINGGVFADFTALAQLEMHCLDVVASLLPPNLRRLVLRANADDAVGLMVGMTMLAPTLSKRPEIDIILHYVQFKTPDRKSIPKLSRLPAIFAKLGLNLSLHVCPPISEICKYIPETILSNLS